MATTTVEPAVRTPIGSPPTRSVVEASRAALWALLLRDVVVLRKHLGELGVNLAALLDGAPVLEFYEKIA